MRYASQRSFNNLIICKIIKKVYIIDCRFGYEYEGGHIRGALNLMTNQDVERVFMTHISPLKVRDAPTLVQQTSG